MQRRSKREQNHSSAITVWCSASGKGGTSKTTLFCFSFVEEEEEESTTSLLEALLTLVEVGGRAWARCAWAQVEQTAERVRSSSLQRTPLCGQYTLLDRRLSISFFSRLRLLLNSVVAPKGCQVWLSLRGDIARVTSLPRAHWLHSSPGPTRLIPGTASFPPKEYTRPSPAVLAPQPRAILWRGAHFGQKLCEASLVLLQESALEADKLNSGAS